MTARWLKWGVLVCLITLSFVSYEVYCFLTKPILLDKERPIVIVVAKNTSAASFVQSLVAKNLVSSPRLLLAMIRLQGLTHRLKAGIYQIKPGESVPHLLNRIEAGDVLVESFRIIDGTTLSQVSKHLQKAPYLRYKEEDWQAIKGNYANPEGLLLADTYNYHAGSEAKFLLRLAHYKLQQYLDISWQSRYPGLPYQSPYDLLIAASILEKEAALPEEKKIIAGIIVNRIKKNMPLQMDPTVIYALGSSYQGKLTHDDLSIDSPYNTYRHRGLPPTPIAMVGKKAIDAAAHPTMTNYLYFVAKGDGSHQFSETYEEQKAAITRYKKKNHDKK